MNEIETKQTESSIMEGGTDAWLTCNFTSFLTVFRSYQDDGWMTCIASAILTLGDSNKYPKHMFSSKITWDSQ